MQVAGCWMLLQEMRKNRHSRRSSVSAYILSAV